MKKVIDFEVSDLGIENSDYFQGYGVYGTDYSYCIVGIGDDPCEALEDCLDQIALNSEVEIDFIDFKKRILDQYPDFKDKDLNSACSVLTNFGDDTEELYYYIGIRWNI